MNFIDYVIKKTDKYTKMGLDNPETKEYLLTLHVLNHRARCMKESVANAFPNGKEYVAPDDLLEIDTELDKGYFDRIIIDPNKESK